VSRQAVYDPESETVQLTITYAAQSAELRGPFLEIIPGTDGGDCPTVSWDGPAQDQNLPSGTGIMTPCGWSIDPGTVPKGESVAVTATVPLTFAGADPAAELQAWLNGAAESTFAAVTDPAITNDSYPAQRLRGIEVVAPSRVVSRTPLRLTIYAEWPDDVDRINPLYRSPSVGSPTLVLTAVAGGEDGVRFSDGCSGALAVSKDRLTVTALNPATDCTVLTTVGNFIEVPSEPFDIAPRAS
jgi:serine/threonine-protein kinase